MPRSVPEKGEDDVSLLDHEGDGTPRFSGSHRRIGQGGDPEGWACRCRRADRLGTEGEHGFCEGLGARRGRASVGRNGSDDRDCRPPGRNRSEARANGAGVGRGRRDYGGRLRHEARSYVGRRRRAEGGRVSVDAHLSQRADASARTRRVHGLADQHGDRECGGNVRRPRRSALRGYDARQPRHQSSRIRDFSDRA